MERFYVRLNCLPEEGKVTPFGFFRYHCYFLTIGNMLTGE